jgi:hypothetical protein
VSCMNFELFLFVLCITFSDLHLCHVYTLSYLFVLCMNF